MSTVQISLYLVPELSLVLCRHDHTNIFGMSTEYVIHTIPTDLKFSYSQTTWESCQRMRCVRDLPYGGWHIGNPHKKYLLCMHGSMSAICKWAWWCHNAIFINHKFCRRRENPMQFSQLLDRITWCFFSILYTLMVTMPSRELNSQLYLQVSKFEWKYFETSDRTNMLEPIKIK